VLAEGDLVAKSPAEGGLEPYRLDDLLGRVLLRDLAEDDVIVAKEVGDPLASDASPVGTGSPGVAGG
jgi:hypothetical protein